VISRTLKIGLIAVAAMLAVMGSAVGLTFVLGANAGKLSLEAAWQRPAKGVVALKLVAAQGERKSDLYVQDESKAALFDARTGAPIFERSLAPGGTTSLGDVDGDGRVDLLLFEPSASDVSVSALHLADQRSLLKTTVRLSGSLDRAIAVRLDATNAAGAVLRSKTGQVVAIGPDAKPRWSQAGPAGELVTLDTVNAGGRQLIVCATKTAVVVFDSDGNSRWQHQPNGQLRRARSLEPTNGQSVVVLGEESGKLVVLAGADGSVLWSSELGQPPTELRLAEFDGDPRSLELVVGGKRSGVWVFSASGKELLASATSVGKISEIASVLTQAEGGETLVIGGADGMTELIVPPGRRSAGERFPDAIDRMLGATPGGQPMLFVATGSALVARTLTFNAAPAWYSLLWAGALGCLVVGVVASLLARTQPAPPLHLGAEQMTIEAQRARKIMLRESLNELKQLSPRLAHADVVQRLRELREQIADADRRLLQLGANLQPQIFACPRCGGPLEIGVERCDYCGSGVVG
jgi:outer membrane protein assembly factor BamB